MVSNLNVYWMIRIFVLLWKVWYFLGELLNLMIKMLLILRNLKISQFASTLNVFWHFKKHLRMLGIITKIKHIYGII